MRLTTQLITLGMMLSGISTASAAKQDWDDVHVRHVLLISVALPGPIVGSSLG
jgi:hypothetical protein